MLNQLMMAEETNEKFNIRVVHDMFEASLYEDDDVLLKEYLESYKELYKFFNLMGTVFGFVSTDVKSKIDILSELLDTKQTGENFKSVKSMVAYEKAEGLLKKHGYVSGSRTMLRLHRGLDFIRAFLQALGQIEHCDPTSSVCQEAYNRTLAQHHPWYVRTPAIIAMYTMPSREQLLKRVCGSTDQEVQDAIDLLPKMLQVSTSVYERVDQLYTINQLQQLP